MKTRNFDNMCAASYGYGQFTANKTAPNRSSLLVPSQTIAEQYNNSTGYVVFAPEYSENAPIYLQSIFGNYVPIAHPGTDGNLAISNTMFDPVNNYTAMSASFIKLNGIGSPSQDYMFTIIFGTGTIANEDVFNSYTLANKIDDNTVKAKIALLSDYAEINVTWDPTTNKYKRDLTFNFQALDTFTFSECGLCYSPVAYYAGGGSNTWQYGVGVNFNATPPAWNGNTPAPCMFDYEKPSSPITVTQGETFQVKFHQEFESLYADNEQGTSDEGQDTGNRGTPAVELTVEEQETQAEESIQYEEDKGRTVSTAQEQIIAYALSKVGYKYSQDYRDTGDTDPDGYFDCSSLAYYACKSAGIDIKYNGAYTAAAEANGLFLNSKFWKSTTLDGIQPGDLVFYSFSTNGRFLNISHVAIYTGNNVITHARNASCGVCQNDMRTYGRPQIVGYGRPW